MRPFLGARTMMKRTASAFLRVSGMLQVTALFVRHVPRILMYHRFEERPDGMWPCPDLFERQVKYLTRRHRVLSLDQLHRTLMSGNVPHNAVVLTIDDGYEDFYRLAFPILQKYEVPATLYVTTDFVDGRMWFWWDAVRFILNRTPCRALTFPTRGETRTFELSRDGERRAAWSAIGTVCLTFGVAERKRFLTKLADDLGVSVPEMTPPEFRPVTWEQVREMAAAGIEIGSHTCSHLRLTLASGVELARELVESKRRVEEITGRPVTSLCYPFGRPDDLNDTVRRAVVEAGYRNAVVAYNDSRETDDLFALRRFSVGTDTKGFRRIVGGTTIASNHLKRCVTGADTMSAIAPGAR